MEFALHGLAEYSLISKHNLTAGHQFKDLLSSMFSLPKAEDDEEEKLRQRQILILKKLWTSQLVAEGEGSSLSSNTKFLIWKVVREMIAFANSEVAILIGVDDNGELVGVKYPDEEIMI